METLPFIDEHTAEVDADVDPTWMALKRFWAPRVRGSAPALFVAAWRLEPVAGFAIAEEVPGERLSLRGKHRFSRYELAFELDDIGPGRTRLRARTSAVFPGALGAVYRAAVIGTRGHVLAVSWMLRRIAAAAS